MTNFRITMAWKNYGTLDISSSETGLELPQFHDHHALSNSLLEDDHMLKLSIYGCFPMSSWISKLGQSAKIHGHTANPGNHY